MTSLPVGGELTGTLRLVPYSAEKYRIAEAVGWDKSAYALAKAPFVERVLSTLRHWLRATSHHY